MNVIAIYHHPQECGSPFITFVSQETGDVVESVDIPDGFYYSGEERVDIYTPVYTFTEEVNQTPEPTVDNVRLKANYMPNPHHYVFRVTKVTDVREDPGIVKTWKATVHAEACNHEVGLRYNQEKDTFRMGMEKLGFNMDKWTLDERNKVQLLYFLQEVFTGYHNYHIINIIEIG